MKIICLEEGNLGCSLQRFERFGEFVSYDFSSHEEAKQRIADTDVVIINKIQMNADLIDAGKKLKLILITATGTNNIDLIHAAKKGIIVKNVAGYSTYSVTQHTLALLLALTNHIPYYDEWSKKGNWCKPNKFCDFSRRIHTIEGKTYGIIGMGAIGKKVASVVSALGAKVVYYSSSGIKREPNYEMLSLDELLRTSDFISIHSPLNDKTFDLISKAEFDKMKNGAVLINTGRGGIINEAAAAIAIDQKNIFLGTDVLQNEPMDAKNPLLFIKNKENLIITPHIAWAAVETVDKLLDMVANNLQRWIENGK